MRGRISILVKKASLEFDKMAIPMFAPFDLTPSQYKILRFLYLKETETVRQIDIERFYSMTNPTVTGILQNLEKKGWIERITNPRDSRSKVIRLTEKAVCEKNSLCAVSDELESRMTAGLKEKEKEQLIKLMEKMIGDETIK